MGNRMEVQGVIEDAVKCGLDGYSCSEAVTRAFGHWLGREGLLLNMASGFAGGVGLRGETCGVVAAAILVLGAEFGGGVDDVKSKRRVVVSLASEFAEAFAEENGSTLCAELCEGADLRSPEGAKALRATGKPEQLIRSGAGLLAGIVVRER